ncbi:bis(5'-nucleosyl)-tetraphosphatase (symmetrical) YqeK [Clostridium swellfunianum]|uniref:bis(5'-nucleosyl)-tetraphosphatase (symmetrical) YqeK n=1 Tax=Clostridium swellfunianum TaxID=1367462 RepID=UPI00202F32B1|nr:bis(5'-nucleosyl)-tetraphosphatase (symmetrical) YqeK [Clostridium swellfunianum]MCM0648943.1 bis(5'-nucleosyl)-tetraphosphatase (symmetrical) YqeK [Clostridium swellfunianum]
MWNEDKILEYLKENLNKQRYEHSLRVRDTSVELAEHYKADRDKAYLAGLVHDCAKNMEDEKIINIIAKNGYNIEGIYKRTPNLMHGLAGALVAKTIMGIEDEEVLSSIAFHTTGNKIMTLLDKIIYIADYIEPMRNFPGVEELRKLAYENLDEALLLSFDNTIKYVISRGQLLHLDTIEARNSILVDKT